MQQKWSFLGAFCFLLLSVGSYIAVMSIRDLFSGGTVYRNTAWYLKGLKEFTRGGYEKAARSFDPKDLEVDVTSKSFMITGSNSGIGKCTALFLAKKGATVHMICRNQTRGEEAKQDIIQESGNDKVHLHLLDISKSRDVARFTSEFVQSEQQLDVLVNNAGCMVNQYTLNEDEIEVNFATNSLGTYMLTVGLIPSLSKSSSPAVITVTSGGMYPEKLDADDLNLKSRKDKFVGSFAYGQNKRQQVVMSRRWAALYPNIHFSTMHPGWADTPAVQSSIPEFRAKHLDQLRTPEQGADTINWLCVSERARQFPSGLMFLDRQPAAEHLAMAWTRSSDGDELKLMDALDSLSKRFSGSGGTAGNLEPPQPTGGSGTSDDDTTS